MRPHFDRLGMRLGLPVCGYCGHVIWIPAVIVQDDRGGVRHHVRCYNKAHGL